MKTGVLARAFAVLIVALFAITLVINSTNSTTGKVISEIAADPLCGVNGGQGNIVIDAETKTFSSKYMATSQQQSIDWLNSNIADCKKAKESFNQYCGTMFGKCRTEKFCEIVDNTVGFDCNIDLPQKCTSSNEEGNYIYSCSIDATTINLGTCTCERD